MTFVEESFLIKTASAMTSRVWLQVQLSSEHRIPKQFQLKAFSFNEYIKYKLTVHNKTFMHSGVTSSVLL